MYCSDCNEMTFARVLGVSFLLQAIDELEAAVFAQRPRPADTGKGILLTHRVREKVQHPTRTFFVFVVCDGLESCTLGFEPSWPAQPTLRVL